MRLLWITEESGGTDADREALARIDGLEIEATGDPGGASGFLRTAAFDAVLADVPGPESHTAEELLEQLLRADPAVPVILRSSGWSCGDAVRLAKLGAFDVVECGQDAGALACAVERALEYRELEQPRRPQEPWRRMLVGESRAMQHICELIRLIGNRRCTVLITGETGTGKEVIARAIHLASGRAHLPMVPVNCTALPENLLEAELFGHVKGAFTGAINNRIGRFEQAQRSTIFLDEIGDMPLELQAKLLRVLQEREIQRIGSSETVRLDVRVVAATNADLAAKIQQGSFREDLYYRLNVVPVRVPALRERISDIPVLVEHFIDKVCRMEDIPRKRVSRETLDRLCAYHWPGNVRQLENAVEMAVALSGSRQELYPADFPLPAAVQHKPAVVTSIRVPEHGMDFEKTVSRFEWNLLDQALRRTGGNKKQAADMLGLKRTTLAAKLKSLEPVAAGW